MNVDDVRLLATAIAKATRNPESDEPDNTEVYVERVVSAFLDLQPMPQVVQPKLVVSPVAS